MDQSNEGTYYRLDVNMNPVKCQTYPEWIIWRCNVPTHHLIVAQDLINGHLVSTVFLPIFTSAYDDEQRPFYETAVFGTDGERISEPQYSITRYAAGLTHKRILEQTARAICHGGPALSAVSVERHGFI